MDNIAAVRRDRVDAFKKVFFFVKLGVMLILSVLGSAYFLWSIYYAQLTPLQKSMSQYSVAECVTYCTDNIVLTISAVFCCVIACAFIGFLAMHGIQKLVVKFMMRNANTGG